MGKKQETHSTLGTSCGSHRTWRRRLGLVTVMRLQKWPMLTLEYSEDSSLDRVRKDSRGDQETTDRP